MVETTIASNKPPTDQSRGKYLPWIVWGLGALFYFYEFMLQVAPNVLQPMLMRDFDISATAFGSLAAVYFFAYASMQLPAGALLDRFGPRKLLTIAILFCAVGSICFGISDSYLLALWSRFLTGLGSSFALVGAMVLAAKWFGSERFALLVGLILTVGMLGAMGGQIPLSFLVSHLHWHKSIILLGFIGFILAIIMWLVIRDEPAGQQTDHSKHPMLVGIKDIIKHKQTWLTALYGALMFAPTAALGAVWGVSFVKTACKINTHQAAGIISLIFLGWAVGGPMFGAISDRIGRRKPTLYIASACTTVTLLIALYLPHMNTIKMAISLFLFGLFSSAYLPCYSIVKELHPQHHNGTALGFMNFINTIGEALIQPLIGFILDLMWQAELQDTLDMYSLHDYRTALCVLPLITLVSLALLPWVQETYNRQATSTV